MSSLLHKLWEFLSSPTFSVIASLATVIPVCYLIFKFLIKPLRIYYDSKSLQVLQAERLHLKQVQNHIEQLDKATYWEDLLYTPLEAEIRPLEIIPPEFVVLKSKEADQASKNPFGFPSELTQENRRRFKDILSIFNKYREPLIILGDPGAGKSVSFRHAVRQVAKSQSGWFATKPLMPVYIPCGHYTGVRDGQPFQVEEFVREYIQRTFDFFNDPRVFNKYLTEGRLILFFDALDEMPKADYSERIQLLSEFAARYAHNRIFFSCRKLDYDKRLNVREVSIRPFDKERRRLFLKKGLSQKFDRKFVKLLIYQLETDGKLSDLLSNPFFCQLVIFYIRALEVIPTNRYQLFSVYIERRLAAEQSRWKHIGVTSDEIVDSLTKLGYLMSESRGIGTSIHFNEAVKLLTDQSGEDARVAELLRASVQAKLLLQNSDHHLLQFSHHRLQEYFAARYATINIPWQSNTISKFTDDLWWREILIMMMGMKGDQSEKISAIINSALQDCRNLFDQIIEKCDVVIQAEHHKHGLTYEEDLTLKEVYIWRYLGDLDSATSDQTLIHGLLHVESVIDDLEVAMRSKKEGDTKKLIQRLIKFDFFDWTPYPGLNSTCYLQTLKQLSELLLSERDAIRAMRRTLVNRLALSLTCATNCNLHLGSEIWTRLKECALSILDRGVPLEKVKIIKEIITQDNDEDIRKRLRRLLTGDSRWVSREIFNTLLSYRIPHVGFDKKSLLFLFQEFTYYGTTGMFREYAPQLMNSSIRMKSLSVLSLIALVYLFFLIFFTGLLPWAAYQWTLTDRETFRHVISPQLILPICWIPVAIVVVLDLAGIKSVSSIGGSYGISMSFLIFMFTAMMNDSLNAQRAERVDNLPAKILILVIACGLTIYIGYKAIAFAARLIRRLLQVWRFWWFRHGFNMSGSFVGTQLSITQLLEFYESFESRRAKEAVIQLLEKNIEYDETLINKLTDFAYHEKDKYLADLLWRLIYELEKRGLRAA